MSQGTLYPKGLYKNSSVGLVKVINDEVCFAPTSGVKVFGSVHDPGKTIIIFSEVLYLRILIIRQSWDHRGPAPWLGSMCSRI
jgi:hypothetical protein